MQTIGKLGARAGNAPAASLLEQVAWLDKLPLTILCGLLLGFSSAGYGVWWLSWVGLVPLLLLIYGSRTRSEAMLSGLIFGLAYHLVALRWLLDLYPLDWLGIHAAAGWIVALQAWLMESLHEAVLFAVFALFVYTLPMRGGLLPQWQRPYFPLVLAVPLIWIFLQWVVAPAPFFLGIPIVQLAYSQAREPALIQVAKFGGAQLVDFLIVFFNCTIFAFILEMTNLARKLPSRADLMSDQLGAAFDLLVSVFVIAAVYALGRAAVLADAAMPLYWQKPEVQAGAAKEMQARQLAQAQSDYAPDVPIAVGQSDLSADDQRRNAAAMVRDLFVPLIDDQGACMIALPAGTLDEPARGTEPLRLLLKQMAHQQKKDFLVGVRERGAEGLWDGVRLFSADHFNQDNDYMKYRLVPLIEYTPINFLSALLPKAVSEHITGGELQQKAPLLKTLKAAFGRVGASVGIELVYPDLILSEVNRGASLLANFSDLSAFHGSILAQELLAAAALRAVENGRYFIMSSNLGVSAVIDPQGVVTSSALSGRSGVLLDRVQFLHRKSPFTRMCTWIPLYH